MIFFQNAKFLRLLIGIINRQYAGDERAEDIATTGKAGQASGSQPPVEEETQEVVAEIAEIPDGQLEQGEEEGAVDDEVVEPDA